MSEVATIAPAQKRGRHSWGDPVRFPNKTERTCVLCSITKVTRLEPGTQPWLEFFRGLERIQCEHTPVCEASA